MIVLDVPNMNAEHIKKKSLFEDEKVEAWLEKFKVMGVELVFFEKLWIKPSNVNEWISQRMEDFKKFRGMYAIETTSRTNRVEDDID